MGRPAIDHTGERFGNLVVLERSYNKKPMSGQNAMWLCKCDCGNYSIVSSACLVTGSTKSCGCLLVTMHKTHGKSETRLYGIWNAMKQRCFNKNSREYRYYGGRGITVCNEWKTDFVSFEKWAFESGYVQDAIRGEFTIDRINPDGNYEPSNCRWISISEQQENKRKKAIRIEIYGGLYKFSEIHDITGIPIGTLRDRYYHGNKILKDDELELFKRRKAWSLKSTRS